MLNWLLYYPVEWGLSYWTDVLITINKEDFERAHKTFHAKRIVHIPGVGVDVEGIRSLIVNKEEKRNELRLQENDVMLLSVGELIPRKNHELVIRALKQINDARYKYFICGQGELKDYLLNLAKELGVENQVKLLGFRNDVWELCKVADIYIFPSHQEGLSVALMEAIASGIPILCSEIRGNIDLVDNNINGLCFNPKHADEVASKIQQVLSDSNKNKMSLKNPNEVEHLSVEKIMLEYKGIYKFIDIVGV